MLIILYPFKMNWTVCSDLTHLLFVAANTAADTTAATTTSANTYNTEK